MREWEPSTAGRRSPLLLALVVLGVVIAAGFLVRTERPPAGRSQPAEAQGRLEVREEALPGRVPAGSGSAQVHALDPSSLQRRRPALEVDLTARGRLVTAVSERGRPLLVLARESPNGRTADVRVLDATTLEVVANLGYVPGPVEHLAVTGDGRAVVSLRPARVQGEVPTLHHLPLRGGAPASFPLPAGFRVREVGALRLGRVAVAGTAPAALPDPPLTVLVFQLGRGRVADAEVDLGAGVGAGGRGASGAGAAFVWDLRRQLLHVVHATQDRLTTVRLHDGAVLASAPREAVEGRLPSREAVLAADGDAIVATGALARAGGQPLARERPLRPLWFATDRATLSFTAGTPAALLVRGTAREGRVIAIAGRRAVLERRVWWPDAPGAELLVVEEDLMTPTAAVQLPGAVMAAQVDADQTRLRVAAETPEGVEVAVVDLVEGRIVAASSYGPGAEVHLGPLVVIERP